MPIFPKTLSEVGASTSSLEKFGPVPASQSDSGRSTAASGTLSAHLQSSPTIDLGYGSPTVSPSPAVSPTSAAGRANKIMEDRFLSRSRYDLANQRHPGLDLAEYTGRVTFIESNLQDMSRFSKFAEEDLTPSNLEEMATFSKSPRVDLSSNLEDMARLSKSPRVDLSSNLEDMGELSKVLGEDLRGVGATSFTRALNRIKNFFWWK